nr:hypothetical protein [uncultured Desulfobacter sp.]
MKLKKPVKILMSVVVFLFLASASHAATFNLDLSALGDGHSGTLEVYSLVFSGVPQLTVSGNQFSENGSIPILQYTTSSGGDVQFLGFSGLTLEFEGLSGTVENGVITFNKDQTVTFDYNGTPVAKFELLEGSGGQTENAVTQNYYLALIEDESPLINDGTSNFEALIVASDFSNQNGDGSYLMVGKVFAAVPVPQSLLLISSGLCCLVGLRRKA